MNFEQALDWLNGAQFTGIKLGLENTRHLLAALGNPENRLRFIHVAGTNGKGSVCAMLDSCLRAAGYKTGLFTSPHLIDFQERIRLDGIMISPKETAAGLSRLRDATADWDHKPTFFELSTVLALDHFERAGCEIVVLETGMGGRLDSTNVVTPLVSVITPIAMDHMLWLGDNIAKIASEKAGIIKPGIPVVSSRQEPAAERVLRERALETGSLVRFIEEPIYASVALAGEHQLFNAAVAVAALDASGLKCEREAVARGLASVEWPARFQRVGERIVIDGAHNEHSAAALVSTWWKVFGNQRASIVFGALRDKDYACMIHAIEEIGQRFLFVPVNNERAERPAALQAVANIPSGEFENLQDALANALADRFPVLVTGSLFLSGEALRLLGSPGLKQFQPPARNAE